MPILPPCSWSVVMPVFEGKTCGCRFWAGSKSEQLHWNNKSIWIFTSLSGQKWCDWIRPIGWFPLTSPPFCSSLQGDWEQPFGPGAENFPPVLVSELGLSLAGCPDHMAHKNGKAKASAWIARAITHRDATLNNHHLLPPWHCFPI